MLGELAVCVVLVSVLGVVFVWCWVKSVSAVIRIDDYSKIGPVSKLSIVTKLSYLFGFRMPQLENARFIFYPCLANDPEASSATTIDTQLSMTKDQMLEYLNKAKVGTSKQKADTLVVAFSGGAVNKIGVPRIEFRRTLSREGSASASCDQLFALDHTGASFYSNMGDCNIDDTVAPSEQSFGATLKLVFAKYNRVVLVGNCMGATGALRCADMLPTPNCTVIAFNPEIAPEMDSRIAFRLIAKFKPSMCRSLPDIIEAAVTNSVARVCVHSSTWEAEYTQAQMLRCDKEVWIENSDCAGCSKAMREEKGGGAKEREARRVVRFVHQECGAHGMLGDVLRPKGSLALLLDEAAEYRRDAGSQQ